MPQQIDSRPQLTLSKNKRTKRRSLTMKKLGSIIKTVFTDAQEKYGEQMSAAEEHSRQRKVRIDTTDTHEQDSATSASGDTRIHTNRIAQFLNPIQPRPNPAMKRLSSLTIPQTRPHGLKHQHHQTPTAQISPSPNTTPNPIGYLPTTKLTSCTLCTRPIPIYTPALTHLNLYCAAWFHPSCLHDWTKGFTDMNWSPICPGCKRQVEGVGEISLPLPLPQWKRDRDEVSEFERHLRHLMKDKRVAGPRDHTRRQNRHEGGAIVDMDLVVERLVVTRSEQDDDGYESESESEAEDSDEWENEEVEDSDPD